MVDMTVNAVDWNELQYRTCNDTELFAGFLLIIVLLLLVIGIGMWWMLDSESKPHLTLILGRLHQYIQQIVICVYSVYYITYSMYGMYLCY